MCLILSELTLLFQTIQTILKVLTEAVLTVCCYTLPKQGIINYNVICMQQTGGGAGSQETAAGRRGETFGTTAQTDWSSAETAGAATAENKSSALEPTDSRHWEQPGRHPATREREERGDYHLSPNFQIWQTFNCFSSVTNIVYNLLCIRGTAIDET